MICLSLCHPAFGGGRAWAEKMNSCLWNSALWAALQKKKKKILCEERRQWEWCSSAYSWKAELKIKEQTFHRQRSSPAAENANQKKKQHEVSTSILISVCLSATTPLALTFISLFSVHFYPPSLSFHSLFLLSFSLSTQTPPPTPSPITVKLQGGWSGTFLTEKFDCDQNH